MPFCRASLFDACIMAMIGCRMLIWQTTMPMTLWSRHMSTRLMVVEALVKVEEQEREVAPHLAVAELLGMFEVTSRLLGKLQANSELEMNDSNSTYRISVTMLPQ